MINEKVLITEENIALNFAVTPDKPFNRCFTCPSFRNGCSGPNLFAMGCKRACEFLQMTRIFLGYSYQYVADGTKLSLATTKRALNGKVDDPSFFTLKALSDFLIGDPNGKFPCAHPGIGGNSDTDQKLNDALRELERLLSDNQEYKDVLDKIHGSDKVEMQTIRDEAQGKIVWLKQQIARLEREIDDLWAENKRKSIIVDLFIKNQTPKE